MRRHHIDQTFQRASNARTSRHHEARHTHPPPLVRDGLARSGYDIETADLLGHSDVSTTMIYTHVLKVGGAGVRSPLDALPPH